MTLTVTETRAAYVVKGDGRYVLVPKRDAPNMRGDIKQAIESHQHAQTGTETSPGETNSHSTGASEGPTITSPQNRTQDNEGKP